MLDGQHAAISASSTDYLTRSGFTNATGGTAAEKADLTTAPPLLSIEGLLQIVQFITELNSQTTPAAVQFLAQLLPLPCSPAGLDSQVYD
jgi:hypothetical protein